MKPMHDVGRLLDRLPTTVLEFVARLPAQDGMAMITDRTVCVVCGEPLVVTKPILSVHAMNACKESRLQNRSSRKPQTTRYH